MLKTQEQYKDFLDGVNSVGNYIVEPDFWNRFMNRIQLMWVNLRQDENGAMDSVSEDLDVLKVITDGTSYLPLKRISVTGKDQFWPLPEKTSTNPTGEYLAKDDAKYLYPDYFRMVRVYDGDKGTRIDRINPNFEGERFNNYYTKPDSDYLMFYNVENGGNLNKGGRIVRVYSDGNDIANLVMVYLRKPRPVFYDESMPKDNIDNTDMVKGQGSLPLEFSEQQNNEIIDLAIRRFLEIKEDPRYKSFSNEQILSRTII